MTVRSHTCHSVIPDHREPEYTAQFMSFYAQGTMHTKESILKRHHSETHRLDRLIAAHQGKEWLLV